VQNYSFDNIGPYSHTSEERANSAIVDHRDLKMSWLPKFIPQEGLDALKHYKYSAEDHSILTKWFLKRFWDWVVTLFPLWVAYVQI
jgi:hypothetical protein